MVMVATAPADTIALFRRNSRRGITWRLSVSEEDGSFMWATFPCDIPKIRESGAMRQDGE
jgi:hypothetical protein